VPHAGYVYSGRVAATAFAPLRDHAAIERVVVIGPAHYVPVRGIAIPTADAFETPLGRLPVDHGALAAISDMSFVIGADDPHAPNMLWRSSCRSCKRCSGASPWCLCSSEMLRR
jgi:MEMO1 family protein